MLIWPEYISLDRWAGNLQEFYPNEFLPVLESEEKWRSWATIVASSGVFASVGLPPPRGDDWRPWAISFYKIMSNQPNFGIR